MKISKKWKIWNLTRKFAKKCKILEPNTKFFQKCKISKKPIFCVFSELQGQVYWMAAFATATPLRNFFFVSGYQRIIDAQPVFGWKISQKCKILEPNKKFRQNCKFSDNTTMVLWIFWTVFESKLWIFSNLEIYKVLP